MFLYPPATAVFTVMNVQRAGDQAALAPVMGLIHHTTQCLLAVMDVQRAATAVFAVMDVQRAGDQAALAPVMGLILVYALQITAMMTMVLRLLSVAETSFNAVERVSSYADIPPEAPAIIPSHRPPPGWPQQGEVLFEDVVMRYRPDLPPVLRGLSALVRSGEKVGVVGRTGAGLSEVTTRCGREGETQKALDLLRPSLTVSPSSPLPSLVPSPFRHPPPPPPLLPSPSISSPPPFLSPLRSPFRLPSLPPPPLPSPPSSSNPPGTLQFNLDPFSERSDSKVWEALGRAHLREVVSRMPLGLDTEVAEGGENFSVGQRQLISLARALLKESHILVLDEATAAVDVGTDALIQRTVREEFKGRTMLTIAHRLNTIMDSDRILVMDAGMALEYDTPANLVLNETSTFAAMVRRTGPQTAKYSHSSPLLHPTQALEYDTPANLALEYDTPASMVLNEASVFAAMVRSTGPQTAKYLHSVALGEVALADELAGRAAAQEKQMAREAAKWRWATAAQWALALTLTSSQRDLQVGDVLLRGLLAGCRRVCLPHALLRPSSSGSLPPIAEWRWATAAQWALALTLTFSQKDLQSWQVTADERSLGASSVAVVGKMVQGGGGEAVGVAMCNDSEEEEGESDALVAVARPPTFQSNQETRDAAQVLQAVLSGQRSEEISSALTRRQLSEDKWWTAVSRVSEECGSVAKQVQAKLEADGSLALMAKQVQVKLEVDGSAALSLALMAKQVQAKLEADGSLRDSASSAGAAAGGRWAQLASTGEEMAGSRVV
ncbi:unnamed protein product [Closterium sp. NIES-65]|nr:unnamed protein product [Closterium sp. NIES-65]CAI5992638.1 unnamed protein product [Closterium sp. NIES-65]